MEWRCAVSLINRMTQVLRTTTALAFALLLGCATSTFAQGISEPLRPSFWKEYARHNWLAYLSNDFDSTDVEWRYGEVRVDYPSDTQFVFLDMTQQEFFSGGWCCSTRGVGRQGADVDLGESARTRQFSYRKGSEIVFVRFVQAILKTRVDVPASHDPELKYWRDVFCVTKPDEITDTVDVVLELVDGESRQRLYVLDSIRILAHPGKMIIERTGTEPEKSVRRLRLPDEYAGRTVYVRPLPYRWGPSPYGLLSKKLQDETNFAHYLYDEHLTSLKNLPRLYHDITWYPDGKTPFDTVEASTRTEYVRFLRSNYQRDSCVHHLFYQPSSIGLQSNEITETYREMNLLRYSSSCYQLAQADTAWLLSTLKPNPMGRESAVGARPAGPRPSFVLRWDGEMIKAGLSGTKSERNKFIVYDVTGAELYRGTLPPAPFDGIQIPVPDAVVGNIFVRCILADGYEVNALAVRGR